MAEFDPDQFEDKYANYFPELQRAYKNAFETMNEEFDSTLIHAIDQQILNESEPMYDDAEDSFWIDLPESPYDRLEGVVVVEEDRFESVLERYRTELRSELERVFEFE